MKTMKKLFGIVLLLMASMVTSADELVKFDTNEFTGGKVEKTLEEVLLPEKEGDPVFIKVTITVIPDDDYYITKEDIVVMATYPLPETPAVNTRTEGEVEKKPEFANQIELVGDDPQYLTEKRFYTFTIEKGFGVWVTEANFHKEAETSGEIGTVKWSLKTVESKGEADPKLILTLEGEGAASLSDGSAPWANKSAITNLVIGKGVTSLGDNLLSGCDNLTSVVIQNDKDVLTLGDGAIPANKGLTVDVPGNIYNMYKMNDGWKGFNVDSKNKVLMGKVKFVENKNQYDVFAPEQDMKVPVGVSAYSVNKIVGEKIMLGDVETISKGKVVLLYSEEIQTKELYTAAVPEQSKTRADVGDEEKEKERICELKVVPYDESKSEKEQGLEVKLGQVYMLYNDVFYPTQAGRIPVGGIYLEIKEDKKDEVLMTRSFLTIGGVADDADDAITAIESSKLNVQSSKFKVGWYDLRGRKLNGAPTTKGVYINNGKKLIIR